MAHPLLRNFLTQCWEDLLLLHWPVDAEELSKTLPDDLELDLFEGQAWASVVGFRLSELRFSPIPWIPWSDFLEVNLRTYARDREGRRGVWFHSLDSTDPGAVLGARILYGLEYLNSRISMERKGPTLGYRSTRRTLRSPVKASIKATIGNRKKNEFPASSPLDEFLLERYRFWARRKLTKSSSSALVMHSPYDACRVEEAHYEGGLFEACGMREPSTKPNLAHYCSGFPVKASAPSWLFGILGQVNHR